MIFFVLRNINIVFPDQTKLQVSVVVEQFTTTPALLKLFGSAYQRLCVQSLNLLSSHTMVEYFDTGRVCFSVGKLLFLVTLSTKQNINKPPQIFTIAINATRKMFVNNQTVLTLFGSFSVFREIWLFHRDVSLIWWALPKDTEGFLKSCCLVSFALISVTGQLVVQWIKAWLFNIDAYQFDSGFSCYKSGLLCIMIPW